MLAMGSLLDGYIKCTPQDLGGAHAKLDDNLDDNFTKFTK